ncbi:MAG: arsenite methyltransferase [Coriobacteriia bacterium]|nr:arsenite methyltransferase [Coriobacteriia bacterium]
MDCGCRGGSSELTGEQKELLKEVQDRYTRAAQQIIAAEAIAAPEGASCCCSCGGSSSVGNARETSSFAASDSLGAKLYSHEDSPEVSALPETALLASLGCGNPTAVADLCEGETVLDLGSGGGIDVLLSATRVGKDGFAYGLDMTDEMLGLARKNAEEAGATNVEFLKGQIESIPLPERSVDVVISNCVINLSVDKPAVFAEMSRVLKEGGRVSVSDVVAKNELSAADRMARGDYAGCIAGALSFEEYEKGLVDAGFVNICITPTHEVIDGMFAAIVRAVKAG